MSEYKVPCGRTTGHGDSCAKGWLCAGCAEVARLRASATTTAARVEEARREGWQEGMQEAAKLIAEDDAANVLAKLESDLAMILPSTYYMDPPDGGSVDLIEQVRRMAEDAARYRWLRKGAASNRMPHVTQYPYCPGDKPRFPQIRDVGMDAAIDSARALATSTATKEPA